VSSDALEDWHCYSLPAFNERMTCRLRKHCQDGHHPWPAKGPLLPLRSRDQPTHAGGQFRGGRRFSETNRAEGSPAGWTTPTRARPRPLERACPSDQARASSNSHGPTQSIMNARHGRAKLGIAESQRAPTNR
jgi:hypothetical protein